MALFVRDITSACFCRISQHQQVYLSTIEYQRASLRILPIENYNLPFMRPKIPYLSSLLVTCHKSSRLYGVILSHFQNDYSHLLFWCSLHISEQMQPAQGLRPCCDLLPTEKLKDNRREVVRLYEKLVISL